MEHAFIMTVPYLKQVGFQSKFHLTLPHLYDEVEDYVDLYRLSRSSGHFVFQDNSAFELKKTVDMDLIKCAERVHANVVVVPEVMRDSAGSLSLAKDFFADKPPEQFKYAAVCQGIDYDEVRYHYEELARGPLGEKLDWICIPFNYEFSAWDGKTYKDGYSRYSIVRRLMEDDVWNHRMKHHFLGLYNPFELLAYRNQDSIWSNDSSCANWAAVCGIDLSTFEKDQLTYAKDESHVDFEFPVYAENGTIFGNNVKVIERILDGPDHNCTFMAPRHDILFEYQQRYKRGLDNFLF